VAWKPPPMLRQVVAGVFLRVARSRVGLSVARNLAMQTDFGDPALHAFISVVRCLTRCGAVCARIVSSSRRALLAPGGAGLGRGMGVERPG